ncbi:peroxisomal membrane protein 4 [Ascodesmis nigricans]|uniref:Peroxisomal membrane protein 4 n=1 Tax=Ascodesmis nigricans TaxID=341454 RepID=A0A4S2N477_9PEZI|nr:peroxisomal membrane protein 4 [Ascodesmis nigricans]
MSSSSAASDALTRIILDPRFHTPLSILKGFRNGLVYGTKIRFPHALVMVLLFRSGTFRQKASTILNMTRTHAQNLGLFVLLFKSSTLLIRSLNDGKETSIEPFIGGLIGGWTVFGRPGPAQSSVNHQIVIYVFARVVLGLVKLMAKEGKLPEVGKGNEHAWPIFASVSWAMVMWLFRWHPEVLQSSLRSSMTYLYTNSESWDGWRNLLWHNQ